MFELGVRSTWVTGAQAEGKTWMDGIAAGAGFEDAGPAAVGDASPDHGPSSPRPESIAGGIVALMAMRRSVPCVVDTNVLAFDVIQGYRRDQVTALVGAARSGSGFIFAPIHVLGETQRLLEERAVILGLDPAMLYAAWNQRYAPLVRFLDVPPIEIDARLTAVAADDPDDEPTARLALLIAPSYLLSKDRALINVGLATPEALAVAIALRFTGLVDTSTVCTAGAATLLGHGGFYAARLAARHPRLSLLGFTLAGVVLATHHDQIISRLRLAADFGRVAGEQLLGTLVQLMVEEQRATEAVRRSLNDASLDTPLARVSAALARERWPMTIRALAEATGLPSADVADVVRSNPAFVRRERRWQLGADGMRMRVVEVGRPV